MKLCAFLFFELLLKSNWHKLFYLTRIMFSSRRDLNGNRAEGMLERQLNKRSLNKFISSQNPSLVFTGPGKRQNMKY
jgi:hypothetical protein